VSFPVQFQSGENHPALHGWIEIAPPRGSLVGQIALCGSKSLSPFGLVRNLAQHFLPFRVQAVPQIKTHVYANRSTESERWPLHPRISSRFPKSPDFLTRGSLAGPRPPLCRSGACAQYISLVCGLCEEGHRIKEWYSGADPIQSSPPPPEGQHSPAVKQPFF
jgi:hypothetical protein